MIIDYNNYPDNKNREQLIKLLSKRFNNLEIISAAKSLCNRNIYQINIGNVNNNPVLFVGAFHGMEWLTSLLLIRFVEYVCTALENHRHILGVNIEELLCQRGLIVVPCLNPDGVEISLNGARSACQYEELVLNACSNDTSKWQANARGIDLNHNFDADWKYLHILESSKGIVSPAATRYGGTYPESEPETKYLVTLARSMGFRHALAFHSQGEEIYWSFGDNVPSKSKYLADIFSKSSGYKLSEPEGLAIGGGFKDWFIQKFLKPAFTIEIGKGQNPLPLSDLDPIYDKIKEMLVLATIL